jgi:NADP-dependent 3-hydroxy acid dehydrogenase YdfG
MSKVWLITGSGNGLGKDIAEAALAAGNSVVAGARRTEELAPLVAQHGERVKPVKLWKCATKPQQKRPCSWQWIHSGGWTF